MSDKAPVNPAAPGARPTSSPLFNQAAREARDKALWGEIQAELERLRHECERYRLTLAAIRDSKLSGVDFGDWVQAAVQDALDGLMPECPQCGTFVHEGACVEEAEDSEPVGSPDPEEAA